MKITVFGLTISSSWGNGHATPYRAIFRALHGMGHEVHFFEKDVPYYSSRRDLASCDYCNLVLYPEWTQIRERALQTANESDIVMAASYLPDGRRICDEILTFSRPLRVFYDLDTPITLVNLESGGVDYVRTEQLAEFDLVLSFTGGKVLEQLETKYNVRMARPLYGCVDPEVYERVEPDAEFICDLSYMGTFAADRQAKVDELFLEPSRRHPEKQFVLAGSLYPWDWQWGANVKKTEHVPPQAHPTFYSSSRITLNLTREEMARNGWCPSGRFFEAAACGTPLITDSWPGLESFFEPGSEIRVVHTANEVEAALDLPDGEVRAMADRAQQRTLDCHTGAIRARELLQYIEEARSAPPSEALVGKVAS